MAMTGGSVEKPRRFYTDVSVEPDDGGFAVRLDSRTPRSPRGRPLVLPTQNLAELLAEEWRRQGPTIEFAAMPATRLAFTALDVAGPARPQTIEGVVQFAGADLLCYFAEGPAALVRRQEETWSPLLDWAESDLGLQFHRTAGVVHREQPGATLDRLQGVLASLDDFSLAGLAFAAALFGSAVLALALRAGRVDAGAAMAAARLDEIFQQEQWGVDAEAAAIAETQAAEAAMAERWFIALRNSPETLVRGAGEG